MSVEASVGRPMTPEARHAWDPVGNDIAWDLEKNATQMAAIFYRGGLQTMQAAAVQSVPSSKVRCVPKRCRLLSAPNCTTESATPPVGTWRGGRLLTDGGDADVGMEHILEAGNGRPRQSAMPTTKRSHECVGGAHLLK